MRPSGNELSFDKVLNQLAFWCRRVLRIAVVRLLRKSLALYQSNAANYLNELVPLEAGTSIHAGLRLYTGIVNRTHLLRIIS